jgi:hypothetical protein
VPLVESCLRIFKESSVEVRERISPEHDSTRSGSN